MTTRITIITCSYQQASYLGYTLRSVIDQRYPNLEYLVIDGGSTDGSAEVIEGYAKHLAYSVSERDNGQSEALNKGFQRSTGEIVGWLCSDDLLLPGSLERVAAYFDAHPGVDAVYGNALLIDASGAPLRAKREMGFSPFTILYDHNYIPQPSMFWRRRLMDRVGALDQSLHLSMDADYWLRFAVHGTVRHIPDFLSCMRSHGRQKVFLDRSGVSSEAGRLRQRYANIGQTGVTAAVFRRYARLYRVAYRWLSGGYNYSVPEESVEWLKVLHRADQIQPGSEKELA